ncbi:MAG: TerB family tellurite resistance protein [Pirellulaceae bacterium]
MSYDPEVEQAKINDQLLRVMIMAALADGRVDDGELSEIKKQYSEVAGLPVPQAKLEQEIQLAKSSNATLNSYVSNIAGELSPHGKALVVKLAFHTMTGSGQLQPGHESELSQLAKTLAIPDDQYRELISQISELDD